MTRALHQAVVDRAEAQPEVVALRDASTSLTYGEVAVMSAAIARSLSSRRYLAGSIIGVYLPRSPELVVALLGVLRSGFAYLPLDPEVPAQRIAMLIDDSGASAVITTDALADNLGESTPVLLLDGLLDPPADAVLPSVAADELAYVIFTSGSTGRPKGVAVPHSCVVALVDAMFDHVEARPGQVWVSFTSPAFDISVFEFFGSLSAGMTLELADASTARIFESVLARADHDITHLQATPTLLFALMLDKASKAGVARLKHLILGGEALPASLAADLRSLLPGAFFNAYGPTEATIWSSLAALDEPIGETVSIGRPLRGQSMYVLDAHGDVVVDGVVGELFIGGCGVAWGYIGRPGLTAERFMVDHFSNVAGARMYRTGDLAKQQPNGTFVCLGRNDRQVKISGHRIELDEVEHVLVALDEVTAGAVIVVGDRPTQRIVAVVKGNGDTADGRRIRSQLAEFLAAAAVPAEVRFEADLPTTTSGKIDRKALGDRAAPVDLKGEQIHYVLLVNDRGQHAIAWAGHEPPSGWRQVASEGTAADMSLAADRLWADIRPSPLG